MNPNIYIKKFIILKDTMKNKLAENMLRFGVKNLKESDIKNINQIHEQTEPLQPYAQVNPNSWKFKDQAALNAAFDPRMYPVAKIDANAAAAGVYGPWAWQLVPNAGGKHQLNPNAQLTAQALAADLALLMAVKGNYNIASVTNFAQVLKDADTYSSRMYNANNNFRTPAKIIGNTNYGISTQTNTRGETMSQKQWEATLQLIGPAINTVIQKYVMPKQSPTTANTTAPAAPGKTAPKPGI